MTSLAPQAFQQLRRGRLGDPYEYVVACPSTQDLLRDPRLPEGAVAVAEHQTSGRGRQGRAWEDSAGSALLCSVLLRPQGGPLPQLSLVVALATAEAVEDATDRKTSVKWPNDVLLDERKVAGILLEVVGGAIIAGVGVNVNQHAGDLPAMTRRPAGSLRTATGRTHDRGELLAGLLLRLEQAYDVWCEHGLDAIRCSLDARSFLRGRAVRVDGVPGVAGGVAAGGGLEVVLGTGETIVVESGEVEPDEISLRVDIGEERLVDP